MTLSVRVAALIFAAVLSCDSMSGTIFTVTTTADSGPSTLRQAITDANLAAGPDDIHFAIPGAGPHAIAPLTNLPTITSPVTIDGTTQSGFAGLPLIELRGAPGISIGLRISAGSSTVRGLAINRVSGTGIWLELGDGNTIVGNFIGTDPSGTTDFGNGTGIGNQSSSSNNVIGGVFPADRNVVSGNNTNIFVAGDTVTIRGNYIGVTANGSSPLGGTTGITLTGSDGHIIGGSAAGAGNVISGHSGDGISGSGVNGVQILGNLIGTNAAGNAVLPNNFGIDLVNADDAVIGGTAPGARNVISGNNGMGILLNNVVDNATVQGNFIGVAADGVTPMGNGSVGILFNTATTTDSLVGGVVSGAGNVIAYNGGQGIWNLGLRNRFLGNSIHSNATLGIDNGGAGVTSNDVGDGDTGGGNDRQNFPVLHSVLRAGPNVNVQGTLNSLPSASYTIEFFTSNLCDPSAHGEGQTFLGSTAVVTDATGNVTFNAVLPAPAGARQRLTATATDAIGNTSEFSVCVAVAAQFFTLTPCRVADTRDPNGPFGGPMLVANADRVFGVVNRCGIPATAQAVSFNFTITGPAQFGDIRVYPAGQPQPLVSTLNYRSGQTRANNAIVPLGPAGDVAVRCVSGSTHFIIDVNGYFE